MKRDDFSILINDQKDTSALQKGLWIVVINAARTPPHIGLLFNGAYFSLNIKGVEKNIEIAVLLRTIEIQSIKTIFIKLKSHPVFSVNFLKEFFELELEKYPKVTNENTCFKPIRTFFQENFVLWNYSMTYLYNLFPALNENEMVETAFALNMDSDLINNCYTFKEYSNIDIEKKLNEINRISK